MVHEVQASCANDPGQTPAGQYFCNSPEDQLCLYHDTAAWCTQTDLTDCPINQPLRNGDCKVPANMVTRMSGTSADNVGVYYGPEVRHPLSSQLRQAMCRRCMPYRSWLADVLTTFL